MKLKLLSQYRTQLMGFAILWVMFFHSHIHTGSFALLGFIKSVGYGGVDIFMLLSGFGVYYSISKESSIKNFYKKRALRILPYYLPIVLIVSLIAYYLDFWSLSSVIHNMLTTGFWMNIGLTNMFDWYIPSLIALYLLTPLFYKFFKKNKTVTTVSTIIFFYVFSYVTDPIFAHLYSFTFRAPLYILGFWIGDYLSLHKDKELSKSCILWLALSLIAGVCSLYFLSLTDFFGRRGTFLVPFALITFPLCMFISYFFSLFKQYKFPILTFFGTYTLTLYIFHERMLWTFNFVYPVPHSDTIAFIFTVILAVVWQKLVERIVDKVVKK